MIKKSFLIILFTILFAGNSFAENYVVCVDGNDHYHFAFDSGKVIYLTSADDRVKRTMLKTIRKGPIFWQLEFGENIITFNRQTVMMSFYGIDELLANNPEDIFKCQIHSKKF